MARFIASPVLQCVKCYGLYNGIINSAENKILYSHEYPYRDGNLNPAKPECEDVGKEFIFSISEFYRDIS